MQKTTNSVYMALLYSAFSFGFLTSANAQCLITTGPTNNCSYGDAVDVLTINGNTVSNSGCSSPSGYTAFASPTWNFTLGSSYPIAMTVGGAQYNQGVSVWIDVNGNGQYESTEQVYASTSPALSHTGTLTIPAVGITGLTVMRVMCAYNISISAANACTSNQGTYGETEDYPVMLSSPVLADDIEVTSIISPADNSCGSIDDSLVVRITNVGLNTASNIQVDATLSGMLTGSYSSTVTTLASGAFEDVFLTTLDTEAGGALTIAASATYSADGNAANDNLNATVNLTNATDLLITGPAVACVGDAVSLSVNTVGSETYDWAENGVSLGSGSTVTSNALAGNAQFIVTSSNACRASDTLDVSIPSAPTATFTTSVTNLQVNFTGAATNYTSVTWDFGDGGTSTGLTPTYTYPADGSYYVCMTAVNQCDTLTFCDSLTVSTVGLIELGLGEVSVYPNPSNSIVNVTMKNMNGFNGKWLLLDIDGRVLLSGEAKVLTAEEKITLSMEPFAPGNYIFRLKGKVGQEYQVNLVRN